VNESEKHTSGSVVCLVETITRVVESVRHDCFGKPAYTTMWRVLVSFKSHSSTTRTYRAAHFLYLPRLDPSRRDLVVGDNLILEGSISRLTFSEWGNARNQFLPLELTVDYLRDPFWREPVDDQR